LLPQTTVPGIGSRTLHGRLVITYQSSAGLECTTPAVFSLPGGAATVTVRNIQVADTQAGYQSGTFGEINFGEGLQGGFGQAFYSGGWPILAFVARVGCDAAESLVSTARVRSGAGKSARSRCASSCGSHPSQKAREGWATRQLDSQKLRTKSERIIRFPVWSWRLSSGGILARRRRAVFTYEQSVE
jgi:hypothetical protein